MTKKLWHITRDDHSDYSSWDAFVIRAGSVQEAHEIACEEVRGQTPWYKWPEDAPCVEIKPDGESKVILGDFNPLY